MPPDHPAVRQDSSPSSWVLLGEDQKWEIWGWIHRFAPPDTVYGRVCWGRGERGRRGTRRQRRKGSESRRPKKTSSGIKGPLENNRLEGYCALAQILWPGLNRLPDPALPSHWGVHRVSWVQGCDSCLGQRAALHPHSMAVQIFVTAG